MCVCLCVRVSDLRVPSSPVDGCARACVCACVLACASALVCVGVFERAFVGAIESESESESESECACASAGERVSG